MGFSFRKYECLVILNSRFNFSKSLPCEIRCISLHFLSRRSERTKKKREKKEKTSFAFLAFHHLRHSHSFVSITHDHEWFHGCRLRSSVPRRRGTEGARGVLQSDLAVVISCCSWRKLMTLFPTKALHVPPRRRDSYPKPVMFSKSVYIVVMASLDCRENISVSV